MFSNKSTFLDSDSSILEKKLQFVKNGYDDEINTLLADQEIVEPNLPFKTVKPVPGFCIKAHKALDDTKIFINICQTDAIPSPQELSEAALMDLLISEKPSSYKIPMSICEPRQVKDKLGKDVTACDIAVNPSFIKKVEKILLFREFLTTIVFEAMETKYNIPIKEDTWQILKNRKSMGNLVSHRIQQRDVQKVKEYYKEPEDVGSSKKPLIEEVASDFIVKSSSNKKKSFVTEIEEVSKDYVPNPTKLAVSQANTKKPEYRLIEEICDGKSTHLVGEFYLPDCNNMKEISLEVNEDRILLEVRKHGYLFDGFFPVMIDTSCSGAQFDTTTKVLTVTMTCF